MTRQPITTRFGPILGSATIGAMCGGLLASFGSVISSSTPVIVGSILSCALLGAWLGRFGGGINGAIIGGMLTALGAVMGGSVVGVVCTISVCALLGGWLQWRSQERESADIIPQSLPSTEMDRLNAEFAYGARVPATRYSLAATLVDDMWLRWEVFQASRMLR